MIRREKCDPASDFWHVLRVGLVITAVLYVILPMVIK